MNNVLPASVWRDIMEGGVSRAPVIIPPPSEPFPKFASIPRLVRECTVTEKIDGTNGLIRVGDDMSVRAGSRNRWLNPDVKQDDNYGFGRWVREHEEELALGLGPGDHYGEWWGAGIARRYDQTEKRFSLFNTFRWNTETPAPKCCSVVPILFVGDFESLDIMWAAERLKKEGSLAAPGFQNPEGICVYHHHAKMYFKFTLGGDGHKSAGANVPQAA